MVVGVGIEPTFRVFQTRANPSQLSDRFWGSWQDSNPQRRRSKRRTLPVELQEQLRMERAVRLELTIPDLQSGALAAWRRAQVGTEGEIRTLESSLEDSHVSSY